MSATPGPWEANYDGHGGMSIDSPTGQVGFLSSRPGSEQADNANLVIAAPALLALVKALVQTREKHFIRNEGEGLWGWDERAVAAINAAEGREAT